MRFRYNLTEYNRRFEAAAEMATDGLLIVDHADCVVFASAAAAELLGYDRAGLSGYCVMDLMIDGNREKYSALKQSARENPGQKQAAELKVLAAWGQELEVEAILLAQAGESEAYISLRDVSLSKIMERELLKSNQFLRKVIIGSVDGIIAVDVSGNVLLYNQGAANVLGWTPEEVIGRGTVATFFEPGTAEALGNRLRADDEKDGPSGILNPTEVNMLAKSGEIIPVNLSLSSIIEWGREVAVVGIFTDLRERVAMERKLKETRDYLNNVVENAFDMIITTDLETNIVSFNRGAERLLGYNRDEVLGKSVEIFYPNPEERRALMRRMEHFDGAVTNYETKLLRKNGSLVDINTTISLLADNDGKTIGTVGISKDITEQKKARAELQETKDYLYNIVENTADIIITTNLEKQIVSFNQGAEKVLGYTREEVMGVHIEDLYVDSEERRVLIRRMQALGKAVTTETRLKTANGRVVYIDLTLSHLRDNRGNIIGTVGISKDITEKKRMEAELEQKKAELEEAQLQLLHSEKMASLGKLATSVAHEINNPLGGILLFCEMILEEIPEDDDNRTDLLQIREQTLRCKNIVKGLLEFGRMTGTQYSFIDLNRTVEQGIALFANQAIFQNIKVIKHLDPQLPQIMGDASQINQVFTNLIINAVDAMDGQGTLTIRTQADTEAEEVVVEFSDTGQGIDPDVLPRLFEPFFTTKPVGEGVGLGLSTSYSIIKRHKGRIEVRSKPGRGATFIVHLPQEGLQRE